MPAQPKSENRACPAVHGVNRAGQRDGTLVSGVAGIDRAQQVIAARQIELNLARPCAFSAAPANGLPRSLMATAPAAGNPSSPVTVTVKVACVRPPWSRVSAASVVCVAKVCEPPQPMPARASPAQYPVLQPTQAADRGGSCLSRAPAPKLKKIVVRPVAAA